MIAKLGRSFYERPTIEVARELLGKVLVRRIASELLEGRIVEVEAYTGEADPGSHAYRGRRPRTEVMFGPAGHLYVYFTYGMHFCMNVVAEREGEAGAVLVRALEPLSGISIMQENRGPRPPEDLCNGPAKLCQAFAITRRDNGADLEGDEIWVGDDGHHISEIRQSTRIGLSRGRELPLRFFVAGSPFLSRGKPSIDTSGVP